MRSDLNENGAGREDPSGKRTFKFDESAFAVLSQKPRPTSPPNAAAAPGRTVQTPGSTANPTSDSASRPAAAKPVTPTSAAGTARPAMRPAANRAANPTGNPTAHAAPRPAGTTSSAGQAARQNAGQAARQNAGQASAPRPLTPEEKERRRQEMIRRRAEEERRKAEEERRKAEEEHRRTEEERRRAEQKKKDDEEKARQRQLFAIRSRRFLRDAAGYCVVFLCFFLIISILSGAVFLIGITATDKKSNDEEKVSYPPSVTYVLGGKKSNVPISYFLRNDLIYVNFSDVANLRGLTVSGDPENLKFSVKSGEILSFFTDSDYCLVNGNSVRMSGAACLSGGDLWIPLDFVQTYVGGITASIDVDESGVAVLAVDSTPDDVSFLLKSGSTLRRISDSSLPEEPIIMPEDTPTYSFINDLTSFYPYMDPEDRNAYLVLINPSHTADGTYSPTDLVDVVNKRKSLTGVQMRLCAEKSLEAMFVEMYAAGHTSVSVSLGFRSYATQEKQFNVYVYNERYYYRTNFASTGKWFSDTAYAVLGSSYIKTNYINKKITVLTAADAKRVASSYSAVPGTGDHQTGLCCDITDKTSAYDGFSGTASYKWLKNNAYKFGFVERYPEGKEKVTGFSAEPCHWRFVGQYHAAIMHENDMCLEEYVEWLAVHGNN